MKYWDEFYQSDFVDKSINDVPSQFAIFALNEMFNENINHVVEFGCGTGKDSIFFTNNNMHVLAFDKSKSAIKLCQDNSNNKLGTFVKIDNFDETKDTIQSIREKICIYTRFFIHALSDEDILSFMIHLSEITKPHDLFISEFRIIGDEKNTKETSKHFRNFIDPSKFLCSMNDHNFKVRYKITGTGYAKYKDDDALVMRVIGEKM